MGIGFKVNLERKILGSRDREQKKNTHTHTARVLRISLALSFAAPGFSWVPAWVRLCCRLSLSHGSAMYSLVIHHRPLDVTVEWRVPTYRSIAHHSTGLH